MVCCLPQDGGTPLFVACQCNHEDVVAELLSRGADIHAQMIDGATPLFITAQNGHAELLKFLLSKGADANMTRKVSGFKNTFSFICIYVLFFFISHI